MKELVKLLAKKLGYTICTNKLFETIYNERNNLELLVNDLKHKVYSKQYTPAICDDYEVRNEFQKIQFSNAALQKLIDDYEFETVLDIGAGAMHHSEIFADNGKQVTAIDFGVSVYYKQHMSKDGVIINKIIGDFNTLDLKNVYDCVWVSHILEHQTNAEQFLSKLVSLVKEGGIIAITVPPFKHVIVGGHVSLWNAGLVLYRLILAGVDCSSASILSYDYNISVIVRKKTISLSDFDIEFDCGDIRRIKKFLPAGLEFFSNELDDPFNGNIRRLNW